MLGKRIADCFVLRYYGRHIRSYIFEMCLLVFLCDEVVQVIRLLARNTGPIHMLGKRIADCFVLRYYGRHTRSYIFEMCLLVFLCDEVVQVIRLLDRNTGPIHMLGKRKLTVLYSGTMAIYLT